MVVRSSAYQREPRTNRPRGRGRPAALSDEMPLREYVAEFLDTHGELELAEIPAGATLDALALDSLTVLSLVVLVEKKYGRDIPESKVVAARTFADLMGLLELDISPAA